MKWVLFETGSAKWLKFMENGKVQFHSNSDEATRFESSKDLTLELLSRYGLSHYKDTITCCFGYHDITSED